MSSEYFTQVATYMILDIQTTCLIENYAFLQDFVAWGMPLRHSYPPNALMAFVALIS